MERARGASGSSRDITTTGSTLPSNPKSTIKTSPIFGVIELAPNFVAALNIQQIRHLRGVQTHRHFARPHDLGEKNAKHLGSGRAERLGEACQFPASSFSTFRFIHARQSRPGIRFGA